MMRTWCEWPRSAAYGRTAITVTAQKRNRIQWSRSRILSFISMGHSQTSTSWLRFTSCALSPSCSSVTVSKPPFPGSDVGCRSLSVRIDTLTCMCLRGTGRERNRNFDTVRPLLPGVSLSLECLSTTISAVEEMMGENALHFARAKVYKRTIHSSGANWQYDQIGGHKNLCCRSV